MGYSDHPEFKGSPIDIVETMIFRDHLPEEQAGYIVARYALALTHKKDDFEKYADHAMQLLTNEQTAGQHVPPLSDELTQLTQDYLAAQENGRFGMINVQVLILSAIVQHGSQYINSGPKKAAFDREAHMRAHRDPEFRHKLALQGLRDSLGK